MNIIVAIKVIAVVINSLAFAGLVIASCSRKMLMIHGTRRQYKAGFLWALCSLIRMYYGGYSNTLFVNPNCVVKTRQENREMRKNRPSKSVMVFEVEL